MDITSEDIERCDKHNINYVAGDECPECYLFDRSIAGQSDDGMVMVPAEPTEAMYEAGQASMGAGPKAVYRAMLSANTMEVTDEL